MLSLFPQILAHFYLRNTALLSEQFTNLSGYFSETKSLMFKTKPSNCSFHPPSPSFGAVSLTAVLERLLFWTERDDFGARAAFLEKSNRWALKCKEMLLFSVFPLGTCPPGGQRAGRRAGRNPRLGTLGNAGAPGRRQRASRRCHIHPAHTCSTYLLFYFPESFLLGILMNNSYFKHIKNSF